MPSEQSVVAQLERAHAIDHRQHPAAQRRQAGDMRRARGTGISVSSSTTDSTAAAGKRDALAGDGHDQQQLVHCPSPRRRT
jgi:hypothetical protein